MYGKTTQKCIYKNYTKITQKCMCKTTQKCIKLIDAEKSFTILVPGIVSDFDSPILRVGTVNVSERVTHKRCLNHCNQESN